MQPGETISPGTDPKNESSSPKPEPVHATQSVPETTAPNDSVQQPSSSFQYKPEGTVSQSTASSTSSAHRRVEWTASESIAHHKQMTWFLGLGAITAVITVLVYIITGDVISTVMVVIVGLAFGFLANRQPHARKYALAGDGIQIDQGHYTFSSFKSFSVIQEDATRSIRLLPMKRFMPAIFMYYAPDDENKILEILSAELPFEKHQPDLVDQFMQRIRF